MPDIQGLVSSKIGVQPLINAGRPTDRLFNSEDYIGIEMELENCSNHGFNEAIGKYWEPTIDGSLKYNGMEFRFKQALNGTHIIEALDSFKAGVKHFNLEPYVNGNRGSTHFHLNISNLSMQELYNFVLLSYFCEPWLMSMCNSDRNYNSFSVAGCRTKDQLVVLKQIASGSVGFPDQTYKYRAIGLNSIYNKGSLEFRMFHATADTELVLEWLNILQEIKDVALTTSNLSEILRGAVHSDLTTVMRGLFGHDIHLPHKAAKETWDFIRELAFNPIEELPMTQKISDFYRKVHGDTT